MDEMNSVMTVADRSDAGQVIVLPSNDLAYEVTLPESGVGYLTLEVPDWDTTVSILTHYSNPITVFDQMNSIEVMQSLAWNASCDDFTEEHLHFHSWGSYVMEVRGTPQSKVNLSLVKRE